MGRSTVISGCPADSKEIGNFNDVVVVVLIALVTLWALFALFALVALVVLVALIHPRRSHRPLTLRPPRSPRPYLLMRPCAQCPLAPSALLTSQRPQTP